MCCFAEQPVQTSSLISSYPYAPVGRLDRTGVRRVAHAPTPRPTSIHDVLGTAVFQRLCVTSGVW